MGHSDQKFEGTPFFKTRADTVLCLGALAGQGFVADGQLNRFYQARYRGAALSRPLYKSSWNAPLDGAIGAPGKGFLVNR